MSDNQSMFTHGLRNRATQQNAPALESASPIWQPTSASSHHRAPTLVAIPNEVELAAVLIAPPDPYDTHRVANEKKELRLGRLFDQLSSLESLTLHKRLANPKPTDELAVAFQRLTIERRTRLLAYLGSPKRRASLGR